MTRFDDLLDALRSGKADAVAHNRPQLSGLAAKLPSARVLDGSFIAVPLAIAVPKGHPAALTYVSDFIEDAKSSGRVQKAFEDAGLKGLHVAPASSRR